jgi:hypothetical protein
MSLILPIRRPLIGNAVPTIQGAAAAYEPVSIRNGGSASLLRGADLTGAADGNNALVSFWLNKQGNGAGGFIIGTANAQFQFSHNLFNNYIGITIKGATSGNITCHTPNDSFPTAAAWHHFLGYFKASDSTAVIYVDGSVPSMSSSWSDSARLRPALIVRTNRVIWLSGSFIGVDIEPPNGRPRASRSTWT